MGPVGDDGIGGKFDCEIEVEVVKFKDCEKEADADGVIAVGLVIGFEVTVDEFPFF